MNELMRFETADGGHVVVEVSTQDPGIQRASRAGGMVEVRQRFEDALTDVRDAAISALAVFRDGRLKPDSVEMEFGVRLNAEAGAVIAKTSAEGHIVVKLGWNSESAENESH
ncbi:CU044_2847 family protein [Streptosporangium sp. NPDC000396]|uniref:CU044_2847 family protein n=1 Tax=Streptosporangium sp. NPDC000396 TaxID=3366185 RepID=UPI003681E0E6